MADRTVVVVGAGITGAFAALDLALRGAEVLLLERGKAPEGATASIAGVLHGGARFLVSSPQTAAVCREESETMRRIASDFLIADHGYFLVTGSTPDDYLEKFLSSAARAGVRVELSQAPRFEGLREGSVRAAYRTSDSVIDLQEFLLHLIWRAQREGVEYLNSAEIRSARRVGDDEWELLVRRGSAERLVRGSVVLAAGHWIPQLLGEVFGASIPGLGRARGSHALIARRVPTVIQLVRPPGIGDLAAPVRGGSFVGPTLVPGGDPSSPSDEEMRSLISSASEFLELSPGDVLGWSSTGRLTFDQSLSISPPDLVAAVSGLVLAYSSNMTCGRRTGEAAADLVSARLGLGRGRTRDIVIGSERPRLTGP